MTIVEEKIFHIHPGLLCGSSDPFSCFEVAKVKLKLASIHHNLSCPNGRPSPLRTSTFNRLGEYQHAKV